MSEIKIHKIVINLPFSEKTNNPKSTKKTISYNKIKGEYSNYLNIINNLNKTNHLP